LSCSGEYPPLAAVLSRLSCIEITFLLVRIGSLSICEGGDESLFGRSELGCLRVLFRVRVRCVVYVIELGGPIYRPSAYPFEIPWSDFTSSPFASFACVYAFAGAITTPYLPIVGVGRVFLGDRSCPYGGIVLQQEPSHSLMTHGSLCISSGFGSVSLHRCRSFDCGLMAVVCEQGGVLNHFLNRCCMQTLAIGIRCSQIVVV